MQNTIKVGVLLTLLTGLLMLFGHVVGGNGGMFIALAFAIVSNAGSFWFSDKIVLAMAGARQVTEREEPKLFAMTKRLVERANLPMPRLYIVDDRQPNAFATGRSPQHAAVAVNSGLLDLLNQDEIEGVLAHELSHVKHRDTLTMTVVATVAGAIMGLASMARWGMIFGGIGGRDDDRGVNPIVLVVMIVVAPVAALFVQAAVSRSREFEADAMAARLTGTTMGLSHALQKLESGSRAIPNQHASAQTAHMYIINPFADFGNLFTKLARTHPTTEKRLEALARLAPTIKPNAASPWG